MATSTRDCPSCATPLPADAAFCYKCGTATPHEINRETGEIRSATGPVDVQHRARLQAALGDGYEVRRLLGRGGFAEVYVAYDKRLHREVAVKTLRSDIVTSESLLQRFQREAEAVAKLRHPNVVPIYSVGEGEGLAYYTMPLIEGESLAAALDREGRLAAGESVRILREAAHALHAAHRAGIVHRDVKPENIMLEGPERSVVVMDFGIAKTEAAPGEKGLTGTGMLVGTPQYMSPEQAMGERELDHRSDQYSLAMVGYHMLAGRLPFEGESVQTQIFKAVTEVPPALVAVVPDVPREISDAIARALSKRPEDRFETIAAFAAALGEAERAQGADGAGRIRRRSADLATRTRAVVEGLPRLTHPLVIAAVLGLVMSLVLATRLVPSTALQVAGSRSEAVFAAREFLRGRGFTNARGGFATFQSRDKDYEFLLTALGANAADQRAARDVPVWTWQVRVPAGPKGTVWLVDVGADNRVVGFQRDSSRGSGGGVRVTESPSAADSASPAITLERARALATQEIVARGWAPAALQPLPDSTITRKGRVDYLFRWRTRDVIRWRRDSADVRLRLTVNGNGVVEYVQRLRVPESYDASHGFAAAAITLTVVSWIIGIVILGFAFAFGVTRQRVDTLQWKPMLRLLPVAFVLGVVGALPTVIASTDAQPNLWLRLVVIVSPAILLALLYVAILFFAVGGESLAQEQRPQIVAGLDDWARGRFIVPETISAAVWGYIYGVFTVGVSTVFEFIGRLAREATSTAGLSVALKQAIPSLVAPTSLGAAVPMCFALLFAMLLLRRWRVTARLAVVLPAVLYAGMFSAAASVMGVAGVIGSALGTLVLTVALWHRGLLAAGIATVVSTTIGTLIYFVLVGTSELVTASVINLAFLAIPAVLAVIARGRVGAKA